MSAQAVAQSSELIVIDLYCRISVDYDGTTRSVEVQADQGRRWVEERAHLGYVLGEIHEDHALSGWKPKTVRPAFVRLMKRLETGAANGVWFRNLDRFTRKPSEGEQLLALAKAGCQVIGGDGTYNLKTARGIKNFRDDMADAAFESDKISERSRRGMAKKAMRGGSVAAKRGFGRLGYLPRADKDELRVLADPELVAREAAAVRDGATRLIAGTTGTDRLAAEWNKAGLLTTSGGLWDASRVRQFYRKPAVAGLQWVRPVDEDDPEPFLAPMNGEPLLDRKTWDRLELYFNGRKRGRPARAYLLSGWMTCGKPGCGAPIYGRPSWSGSKPRLTEDGEQAREYYCQKRRAEGTGCGGNVIDQAAADAAVAVMVVTRLSDPRHADQVARRKARTDQARGQLQAELDQLNEDLEGISRKTGTPGWPLSVVEERQAAYAPQVTELEEKLEALGEPVGEDEIHDDAAADWDKTANDPEARKRMVRHAFPGGLQLQPLGSGRKAEAITRILPTGPSGVAR